jgi:AraC-like DNA-binding protein
MLFLTYTPSLALSQFVNCYICVEGENISLISLPRSTVGIAFRFGNGKNQTIDTLYLGRFKTTSQLKYPIANLICLFDQVGFETVEGFFHIIFVHLNPLGLYHLLKRRTDDLSNQIIPLQELMPAHSVNILMEQLSEIEGFEGKIKVIDAFLIKGFENNRYKESDMDTAVYLINKYQGNIKIKDIQTYCQVSERTLERKFRAQLGFSPKEYARLVRFKKVMQFLLQYPKTPWAQVASLFGYTDQSHLIKDFQYFTTVNPEKFMENENDFSIEKIFSKVV